MATSRYKNTKNEDFDYHDTFSFIDLENLKQDDDFFYVIKERERLDQIARRFLGDGRYWWIICLLNNLSIPFGIFIAPGTILRIPRNITPILMKL